MIMLNYIKSYSDERPDDVDFTSSPTTVYIRKNIVEKTITDESGDSRVTYEYDEAKLSRNDYAIYLEEINVANIDYIAMMSDIEL